MLSRFLKLPENPQVVLIRPPISRWKLYKWYAPFGSHEPSLGLLYIASYIDASGYKVRILDGELIRENKLIEETISITPDIIGITSTTFSFSNASKLVTDLRRLFPESLILMGGSHPSALPAETLKKNKSIDGVIVGEGEETLLEIIQKQDTDKIEGLVWRRDLNNAPVINRMRDKVANLDKYNLNWDLLEDFPDRYNPSFQSRNHKSGSLIVSRGCFYNCSFCTSTKLSGLSVRFHSPDYVINLMIQLDKKYGIKDFYFHDDYFPVRRKWIREFCTRLIETGKNYSWSCASRVEVLTDEILGLMKKSGCRQIGVGVESGSQRVLDRISKKITVADLTEGLKRIAQTGISIKGYFILDTPVESFTDLYKTLQLIFKSKFSHIQFNYYAPLPGSVDYTLLGSPENLWSKMSLQHCLGYSKIPAKSYFLIEFFLYITAYLKIISRQLFNEMFNHSSELSA